jgi:hypothetical protein
MKDVVGATQSNPADILALQNQLIRTGQNQFIGSIWKIVFEASRDSAVPNKSVTDNMGVVFDFYGKASQPKLAQAGGMLLVMSAIKRHDGYVGLPDIPDPAYVPQVPTEKEMAEATWRPEGPRMVKQKFSERCAGKLRGTNYLIFETVAQILVLPEGLAEGWIIECGGNPADGTHMCLLVDEKTGEAHFYGGHWHITRPGGTA